MERPLITARVVFLITAIAVGIWLFSRLWPVLLLLIVSLILAAMLLPGVNWLDRHGLRRGLAVVVTLIAVVLVVVLVALLVMPPLIDQGRAAVERLPELRNNAVDVLLKQHQDEAANYLAGFNIRQLVSFDLVTNLGGRVFGVASTFFTVVVLTAFLLLDSDRVRQFLFYLLPPLYHWHARYLLAAFERVVGGYMRGQLLTSLMISVYTFALLSVLHVPSPLAIAAFAAFADIVPLVGVFLLVIPASLAALAVSPIAAVIVAAALVLYTQFENNILVQWIYGATLDLPGIAVLVGVIVGGELLGVAGALLALPATASLAVLIRFIKDLNAGRISPEQQVATSPTVLNSQTETVPVAAHDR